MKILREDNVNGSLKRYAFGIKGFSDMHHHAVAHHMLRAAAFYGTCVHEMVCIMRIKAGESHL